MLEGTLELKWASLPGSLWLSILASVVLDQCMGESMMEFTQASFVGAPTGFLRLA